jgi:hypothetical protein
MPHETRVTDKRGRYACVLCGRRVEFTSVKLLFALGSGCCCKAFVLMKTGGAL